MKNSADLGGCYPPRPSASVDNTFLDLQNSSYPTQPHSKIANYCIYCIAYLPNSRTISTLGMTPNFCPTLRRVTKAKRVNLKLL